MSLLAAHDVSHVSFILILYSVAFLMYLFVNVLLGVYAEHTWVGDDSNGLGRQQLPGNSNGPGRNASVAASGGANVGGGGGGGGRGGWHSRKASTASQLNGYHDRERLNGYPGGMNGSARIPRQRGMESQQVRDAEEFELEGLMSEDENENENGDGSPADSGSGRRKEIGAV
jgi:hypothetical protein